MRRARLQGRTMQLKVRFSDFTTITRSETVATSIDEGPLIARVARRLLDDVDVAPGVRLLGVSVSQLEDAGVRQLSLDDVVAPSWGAASAAVDEIRSRFGESSIVPATL